MATPVGHLLAGALVGALSIQSRRSRAATLLGTAAVAAAPDLDFIPGLLMGDPSRYHHAASHSVAFVVLVGVAAAALAPAHRMRWAIVVATAYATHLVLDFATLDASPPQGIPLLWPFSRSTFQSPVPLLPNVIHSSGPVIQTHNFLVALRETVLLAPLTVWALYRKGWITRGRPNGHATKEYQ